jgi:hypothetical protein
VAGARDDFCGATILDLPFLIAKLPLVGVTWRGYAAACAGLRTVADRRGYKAFYQTLVPSFRTIYVGVASDHLSEG